MESASALSQCQRVPPVEQKHHEGISADMLPTSLEEGGWGDVIENTKRARRAPESDLSNHVYGDRRNTLIESFFAAMGIVYLCVYINHYAGA